MSNPIYNKDKTAIYNGVFADEVGQDKGKPVTLYINQGKPQQARDPAAIVRAMNDWSQVRVKTYRKTVMMKLGY